MTDPSAAAGVAAYRALSQLGRPATEHRDALRAIATQLVDLATTRAGHDVTAHGAVNEMIRAHTALREQRDKLEQANIDLRDQVDQLVEHYDRAREGLEDRSAEVAQLTGEIERVVASRTALAREHAALQARVDAYLAHHVEYRLYGPCGHTHTPDDPAVVYEAEDIGPVCEDGYVASVCTECCMEPDIEHTLTVEHDHAHDPDQCWPCAPRRALTPEDGAR